MMKTVTIVIPGNKNANNQTNPTLCTSNSNSSVSSSSSSSSSFRLALFDGTEPSALIQAVASRISSSVTTATGNNNGNNGNADYGSSFYFTLEAPKYRNCNNKKEEEEEEKNEEEAATTNNVVNEQKVGVDDDDDDNDDDSSSLPNMHCRLGDFSSGWDQYTNEHLYTKGPTPGEQTNEYAPPESFVGPNWVPFYKDKPQSYDSWSIGVLALELLLGTPNVFSVDQRTNALLTYKMKRANASENEISNALYLAALSNFCIYIPSNDTSNKPQSWPLRHGDPLHKVSCVYCIIDISSIY